MRTLFLILIAVFLFSCEKGELENYRNNLSDFSIYLVKEGELNWRNHNFDINTLQLQSQPWVKSADIDFYDWSAHTFYFRKNIDRKELNTSHFVVVSGQERLFAGVFWPSYMSSIPSLPAVDDIFSPNDLLRFRFFGLTRPGELDQNMHFKKRLIENGIYRAGIGVELLDVKKTSSSKLVYTIEVTNLEDEVIYVPDPKKMGTQRFHYYTNGVSIRKDNTSYWSNNHNHIASDYIKKSWLARIKPGETITRSLTLDGYNNLPTGKVSATFSFPGGHAKEPGEWKMPDGRIWQGNLWLETELTISP